MVAPHNGRLSFPSAAENSWVLGELQGFGLRRVRACVEKRLFQRDVRSAASIQLTSAIVPYNMGRPELISGDTGVNQDRRGNAASTAVFSPDAVTRVATRRRPNP